MPKANEEFREVPGPEGTAEGVTESAPEGLSTDEIVAELASLAELGVELRSHGVSLCDVLRNSARRAFGVG